VEMFITTSIAELPGVTGIDGLKTHCAPAGSPALQARVTGPLKDAPRAPGREAHMIPQKTKPADWRLASLPRAACAIESSPDTHAVSTPQTADLELRARGRTIHCVP
jgi:hypothetical protein